MQSKISWLALTTLILFSGVLGYATLTKGQGWGDDFASYIMQAQSIVEGNPNKFVEENRFTIVNSSRLLVPIAYPWGMPVLLAPLYRVFGPNMLALKSLNLVFYVLFLASIAFFLSERHSDIFLLLFISFFAFNPIMLSSLDAVLSDITFLFFSTTTVFFIGRVVIERRPLISDLADHLLLGVLFAVSFFIRTNAVLLILTAVGVQCVRILQLALVNKTANRNMLSLLLSVTKFDWRTVTIRVSPYATFVGLTLIWYRIFPQGEAYSGVPTLLFTSLSLGMLFQHVMYYFELPRTFFYAAFYSYIIYGATFPFLLAGMITSAYRDYHILLYAFFTVLLYVFLPFTGGLRYFFPVLPFYIHFVFLGIHWYCKAFEGVWPRIVQGLSVCLLAVVALYFLRFSTHNAFANILVHRNPSSGPFAETSHDMFSFIRENTPEDSVVIFFKPRVMRMLTHRRSIQVDNPHNLTLGSYLCIKLGNDNDAGLQLSDGTVQQLVEDQKLRLIYQNSDFRLYRILNLHDSSMRPGGNTAPARSVTSVDDTHTPRL